MTRINVVDPVDLLDEHLRAEFRELTRIPNGVISGKLKLNGDYPKQYTLGAGHVRFFIPRLKWLHERYQELLRECHRRDLKAVDLWPQNVPERLYRGYTVSQSDIDLNIARLRDRVPKNPHYYRTKTYQDFYDKLEIFQ